MAWINCLLPVTTLSLALSLQLACIPGFLTISRAEAQTPVMNQKSPLQWETAKYEPPLNIGAPRRISGAGTRGTCLQNKTDKLITLLPENSSTRTIAQYPTFFAYVPPSTAKQIRFKLTDQSQNTVYQTTLSLSDQPGIVRVSVPAGGAVNPLEVGKPYIVSFTLVCNPDDSSGNIVAGGVIQRVEPSAVLTRELQQASPRLQSSIYAKESLWLEALSTLAQLRHDKPSDSSLTTEWITLLDTVGLGDIAQKPLVPVVSLKV